MIGRVAGETHAHEGGDEVDDGPLERHGNGAVDRVDGAAPSAGLLPARPTTVMPANANRSSGPISAGEDRESVGHGAARYSGTSPIVSATKAPRSPIGLGRPTVVSRVVWCSISAFSTAPSTIEKAVRKNHRSNTMIAPSVP